MKEPTFVASLLSAIAGSVALAALGIGMAVQSWPNTYGGVTALCIIGVFWLGFAAGLNEVQS